jgi:hypothetical protein
MPMNPIREALRGAVTATREWLLAVACQSERTVMLGTILLVSAVSAVTGYVLAQYYSFDILSSLTFLPEDCWGDWGTNIGRHCFSDYAQVVAAGLRPNPFEPYDAMRLAFPVSILPHLLFGLPAKWLGVPLLGLIGYLLAMTIAVLSPAIWAARGTRGPDRVVVFLALGAVAIPAWAVIDRGNSTGFIAPIALVFLVALSRRRWGIVAIMVVLAALVTPQYAALVVALFAARQWRWGAVALAGIATFSIAAYLLWPRYFPETITQSIHNFSSFSTDDLFSMLINERNVSFARGLLQVPDYVKLWQTGGKIPNGFLLGPRSLIGYAILILFVVVVLTLGRRIPPVMVGIVLLATATLVPNLVLFYHLVFVLPIAALIVRDPDGQPGTGLFDRIATQGPRRRVTGICLSLAAALSIAQIAVPHIGPYHLPGPGQSGTHTMIDNSVLLAPHLWLIACAAIMISYARRPAPSSDGDQGTGRETSPEIAVSATPCASEPVTGSSPQGPA